MKKAYSRSLLCLSLLCTVLSLSFSQAADAPVTGWLGWRGPNQNGTSTETHLPEKWGEPLWTVDIAGQSSPVAANGKLYVMGYEGKGPDMQEGIQCLDAETGKLLWKDLSNDYLSDIIYTRYASSSPEIDAETGNVYTMGTQGKLAAYSADGKKLWQHDMMEEYGRLTFPNGRTPSPAIDGELVVVGAMTANWGAHGPGGHRFYAFDKKTGELVYASWPSERPKDSSFVTPQFGNYNGQRVYWAGAGDGSVVCANARTGEPIWRYHASHGGLNASVVEYKDTVIAIHGAENLDASTIGRMIAIKPGDVKPGADGKPAALTKANELWRQDGLGGSATSPVLVGNKIYQVTDMPAKLYCVDADTGNIVWKAELGVEERQASPTFGDGKIYVPTQAGDCYIINATEGTVLDKIKLQGADSGTGICQGTPGIYRGRVYIQTTSKIYCFGPKQAGPEPAYKMDTIPAGDPAKLAKFLVVPADFLLRPDQTQSFRLIGVDDKGNWLKESFAADKGKWEKYIPPTAKVKAMLDGEIGADGVYKATGITKPSAGALKVELNGIIGTTRGRVLQGLPINQDFEKVTLAPRETEPKDMFAFPPLPWIGARFKWEVREHEGGKMFVKTTDDRFFQRAITFMSLPDLSGYTSQADVMSDGQVRKVAGKDKIGKMSEVGLINQRYIIVLKGPAQQIEVNSNFERLQQTAPFIWSPNTWYTLKTRVDIDPATGVGIIRGKAWKKGDPEPEKWTIEVEHKTAHKSGSPGIFGFTPTDMPVYVDNLHVTKN